MRKSGPWEGIRVMLFFGEIVFAYAAEGAYPVLGDIFPGSAWLDAVVGIAHFGVVNVTASVANVLSHSLEFLIIEH